MDVQQELTQKEHELAIARAKIQELEEAYQVQTQDLIDWRNRATQLQNEVQWLQAQLGSARQQIAQLKQQKWVYGGIGVLLGAGAAVLLLSTRK